MSGILRFIVFGSTICCLLVFNSSCTKDSIVDRKQDTIKIARIYQPSLTVGKDAVIESVLPDTNFGDSVLFSVFSWTNDGLFNTARALLEYDLTVFTPKTKITKAVLSLFWISYRNLTEHTGDNAFTIYRIIESWDEHLVTWNNQPDTTTLHKIQIAESSYITQSYVDIDVTEMVRDMIENPTQSHGFMLRLDEEFPYKLVILASSDYPDKSKRPKLVVYY